jgi:branched-chain amino acid transport system ATP-binding protein
MAALELVGVCKTFGSVVVADEFALVVAAGEVVGIIGPNGAGKTSTLNLISGTLRPDRGQILINGQDVTAQPVHVRARAGLGRTLQIPRPFRDLTVYENVLVGATFASRDPDRRGRSLAALRRVGLLSRANDLAGSMTFLDRKRLELARALAGSPRVLLLDEIAGGLTEPEVEIISATIRELRSEGLAIVWIEHIVHALVSVVDRLVATSAGRIIAMGEPRSVMQRPEVRSVYLGEGAA